MENLANSSNDMSKRSALSTRKLNRLAAALMIVLTSLVFIEGLFLS